MRKVMTIGPLSPNDLVSELNLMKNLTKMRVFMHVLMRRANLLLLMVHLVILESE